jgi:hypothetical protein
MIAVVTAAASDGVQDRAQRVDFIDPQVWEIDDVERTATPLSRPRNESSRAF